MILTGDVTDGSILIENLAYSLSSMPATKKLYSGLFVYGAGVPVDTYIAEVLDDNSLSISKLGISNETATTLEFSEVNVGVYYERQCALKDAQNVIQERGIATKIYFREEDDIVRGGYDSQVRRETELDGSPLIIKTKSYPFVDSPDQEILTKHGLKLRADNVITLAYKDFIDNSIDLSVLTYKRITVIVDGEQYEVKEVGRLNHFADVFLNVTFGLTKK